MYVLKSCTLWEGICTVEKWYDLIYQSKPLLLTVNPLITTPLELHKKETPNNSQESWDSSLWQCTLTFSAALLSLVLPCCCKIYSSNERTETETPSLAATWNYRSPPLNPVFLHFIFFFLWVYFFGRICLLKTTSHTYLMKFLMLIFLKCLVFLVSFHFLLETVHLRKHLLSSGYWNTPFNFLCLIVFLFYHFRSII